MKNYSIEIYACTRKGEELIELTEFQRPHFTSREFKDVLVTNLFFYACYGGSDCKLLRAIVKCDGKKVFTVVCRTKTDGETIDAVITAARPREVFRRLRVMNIAS